jgi:hypothetical protein
VNSQNGEKNILLMLKDIGLRVTALEKEHARVQAHDLDGMARRPELLEKSGQQSASMSKVHIAPTAPPQNNDSTRPALAGAASPQKEPDTKRGFFKRIVGAG